MQKSESKTIILSYKIEKSKYQTSSNIARRDILRAGIIDYSLTLLWALLECGYYLREGVI